MRIIYGGVFLLLIMTTQTSWVMAQKTLKLINRGKYEKAERFSLGYLNNIDEYKEINNSTNLPISKLSKKVSAYHALGNIARIKGDYAAAESNYKRADKIYRVLKEKLTAKGGANFWDKVIKATIIGTAVNSRQDRNHYARRNSTASIYIRLGELSAAKEIIDSTYKAMRVGYGRKSSMARTSYATYGEYFLEQSMYDSSRFYYEKYILSLRSDPNYFDLSMKKTSDAYVGLAHAYLGLKDIPNAISAGKKANRFAKHRFVKATDGKNYFGKINTANLLAESYRLKGDYKKALKYNGKALDLFNSQVRIVTPQKLPVLATRGQIFWAKNDTTAANMAFNELVQIFFSYTQNNFTYLSETERAYFYRNNKHFPELAKSYYHYLYFGKNIQQEYLLKRLYEIHLNNKGVLLSSSSKLLNIVYARNDTNLIEEYNEIKRLKEEKNKSIEGGNISNLAALDAEVSRKEKELRSKLSIESEKFFTLEDISRTVPDSTLLVDVMKCVQYNVTSASEVAASNESKYLYFIISKREKPLLVENPFGGNELETRYYRAYLNYAKLETSDDRVYKAYIGPIEKHLTMRKVIVSPDGIYNLINPEIIFDGSQHLISKYDFQSVVSAKDLSGLDLSKPVMHDITLIGWPDYSTHLKSNKRSPVELPGTAKEISDIRKVVDNRMEHTAFMRDQANELVLKDLQSTSILHFATHGFFENVKSKDPMYTSGLILAIADSVENSEDGYLTAYEASNLDLKKTFLVVLSACETGQGAFEEGEGVWGLQRAFQVAGVRYIIMSLFKVNDEITASLMQQFYKNIVQGDHVVTAFRKAQMNVKAKHPLPIEWGAFVIKGI